MPSLIPLETHQFSFYDTDARHERPEFGGTVQFHLRPPSELLLSPGVGRAHMATNVFHVPDDHYRSVTVTTLTALAGVAAALVSTVVATDPTGTTGIYVMFAFVFLQFPLYHILGIDVGEFSTKDHLYVTFMTFSMWFVTWTILLTSGATLPV